MKWKRMRNGLWTISSKSKTTVECGNWKYALGHISLLRQWTMTESISASYLGMWHICSVVAAGDYTYIQEKGCPDNSITAYSRLWLSLDPGNPAPIPFRNRPLPKDVPLKLKMWLQASTKLINVYAAHSVTCNKALNVAVSRLTSFERVPCRHAAE